MALADLPDAEAMRDHFKQMRAATLAQLADAPGDLRAQRHGGGRAGVHWARDGAQAAEIITGIARDHGVTLAAKSKSMATEEIHLNQALQAMGVEAVETDLGEWIIQLDDEPPYHIIAPAIHKTKEQVAELLRAGDGQPAVRR